MNPTPNSPAPGAALVLDSAAIERALKRIANEIIERHPDLTKVALIGIPSRGVEVAQRLAGFIGQLPEGFDTIVGDKGGKLSGGQRQRIALARAILRDPAILILDEATSAVDSQSEEVIHAVLKDFAKNRTVFIISHVLNRTFLDLVTRVVVMDQGKILATGSHDELMESCTAYRALNQSQLRMRDAA